MEVSALSHPARIPGLHGPSALLRLQSDERLIALTRRGQHAAFEVLCARYQSRLLSFCRHMLGSREDAEDVLQEVFAAAFNAVLADERAINVRPWLYRIARNRSLNHLRRATAIGVDSMDVHYAEHGISTGDKVMRRESFRELVADVHKLPETQRTALLLREIDALSYEQIAHAMETTVPSVKSLLVRARISLAEAAEARKLSCDEVRLELGEVAEGLTKLTTPARRHVRECERCSFFRKQLKDNNHALALIMPVGPLLLAKKLLFAKLGTTASAGGAHVAGGAGATVGASATASAGVASAGAGAGAVAGGGGVASGLVTAGAGALATKAAIVTAAAAIVTAGAVAADHAVVPVHRHHRPLA
ncbi:MAG TPA: sigma-70 family RNA polymerase sigma factor, partial [Solirubrobacteraceae bacterium]|nr:sigma-70 family RNA polymerase sigma factor [Solirubrobacteraceae bacterium]